MAEPAEHSNAKRRKGRHSTTRRKIDEASRQVADLVDDVENVIERWRSAIDNK